MGNRASIVFQDSYSDELSPTVYLHWNGGPESVYPFIAELQRRHDGGNDHFAAAARLCQIAGEYLDSDSPSGLSLYVWEPPHSLALDDLAAADAGDNGVYLFRHRVTDTDAPATWPGRWTVRRFHAAAAPGGNGWTVAEAEACAVAAEIAEAYQHPGHATIAKFFRDRFPTGARRPIGDARLPALGAPVDPVTGRFVAWPIVTH